MMSCCLSVCPTPQRAARVCLGAWFVIGLLCHLRPQLDNAVAGSLGPAIPLGLDSNSRTVPPGTFALQKTDASWA